jgi:DNA-binding NtrC family response regulator
MSGLELKKEIAGTDPSPIIFLTEHGDTPSSVKAMKAGASEFLLKPFDQNDVLRAIEAAFELDRQQRSKHDEFKELKKRYELAISRRTGSSASRRGRIAEQADCGGTWKERDHRMGTEGPDHEEDGGPVSRGSGEDGS